MKKSGMAFTIALGLSLMGTAAYATPDISQSSLFDIREVNASSLIACAEEGEGASESEMKCASESGCGAMHKEMKCGSGACGSKSSEETTPESTTTPVEAVCGAQAPEQGVIPKEAQ
jgi:hypothetical protein